MPDPAVREAECSPPGPRGDDPQSSPELPAPAESDTFRLLFQRSADAIVLFDPSTGTFVDANPAAVDLLCCETRERLLHTRPSDWSPPFQPDGRPSQVAAAEIAAESGRHGGHRFEWLACRADGLELPIEVVATPIPISGRTLHVIVARNITGRKLAETALRESQAVLASIADNISEAIYRSDDAHRLIFVNHAFLRMFGYASLVELQAVPREALHASPAIRSRLLETLRREGAFGQQEVEYVRKDGSRFWGLASARIIRDPTTGAVAYHVGAIADITERRRAADEIRLLNATLERRITERTAELSASEARLRTLVDHSPEAIVVYDGDDGRVVSCNENAVHLFGLDRAVLGTCTPLDLSPPFQADGQPSLEAARVRLQEALRGGAPVFEWTHRHASGRLVPCEVRLVRLPAEGQNLVRASVTDNSERHRRELVQQATYHISEAVHTAGDLESLYRRIHDIVQGLMPARNFYIALLDPASQTITFPYYRDEFGAAPSPRPLGTGLTGAILRSGQPLLVDGAMNARKRQVGDIVTFEGFESISYVESGRPSAIWLGVPLKFKGLTLGAMAVQDYHNPRAYGEEEKQILTFVATQTALAIERKRSEQALRESEQKFRALFEASSQGVMLHDAEQFLEVNPATLRILGYDSASQLLGLHPKDTSPHTQPDGRTSEVAAREYIAECMASGSARFEWLARDARGAEVPIEVILTRVEMGGRQIIQAVINDITERKRTEAELRRALERERELGVLKSNFVSMVSHEFRTPLGIIMSSAGILQKYFDRLAPLERREHLESIQRSTRRMGDLMEEVLLLARLDAGRLGYEPTWLDLPTLCRVIADEVSSVTGRRCPIDLRLDLPGDPALADERLFRHILTNLLTNAVKYSEAGSPVEFLVRREGTEAVCLVTDRGIGIAEQDREWLFHAFHRGRNVGQRSGTGLGLVIVQRCLELHRGTIAVESTPGVGTVMTVRLPVYGEPAPSTP